MYLETMFLSCTKKVDTLLCGLEFLVKLPRFSSKTLKGRVLFLFLDVPLGVSAPRRGSRLRDSPVVRSVEVTRRVEPVIITV